MLTFVSPILELQHCNNRNSECRVMLASTMPSASSLDEVNAATASAE